MGDLSTGGIVWAMRQKKQNWNSKNKAMDFFMHGDFSFYQAIVCKNKPLHLNSVILHQFELLFGKGFHECPEMTVTILQKLVVLFK